MNGLSSYSNPKLRRWNLVEGVQRSSLRYRFARWVLKGVLPGMFKVRAFGRCYEPADGSVVYVSNHQSFLDPLLVGMALQRPLNFMARDSLFGVPLVGAFIASVNSFPIRRATADIGALKEAMRRLKRGGQVLLFPEGTRSVDGQIGQMLPGMAVLSQRSADWTVPVVIDGANKAWPKSGMMRFGSNIIVRFAPPISREQARQYSGPDFVTHIRQIMIDMQRDVRSNYVRPLLR